MPLALTLWKCGFYYIILMKFMIFTNFMQNYTLTMFNTGQITLPKQWRTRFDTRHFTAEETEKGLLIKPILNADDPIFYENEESFGLIFPKGIDPQALIDKIKEIDG